MEIIAPDPGQAGNRIAVPGAAELLVELRALRAPSLVGWAAHTDDIASLAKRIAAAGLKFDGPFEGSRVRPDGKTLRWKSLALENDFDSVLPFFIEWSRDSVHPSQDAPPGCELASFRVETPQATNVTRVAHTIGLDLSVTTGQTTKRLAGITGAKGAFELS